MAIGAATSPSNRQHALAKAADRTAAMPDLLVEAQRIAITVSPGWHGRRKSGPGESFWQFRPYVDGDTATRIDWRRSARDDHYYIRDQEWESAQTVALWCDLSPSMLFQSRLSRSSKESRALVLTLALAMLLSRSGERIALPALLPAFAARNGAERVAVALATAQQPDGLPALAGFPGYGEAVLISDFLYPPDELEEFSRRLAERNIRAHLVKVMDPVEAAFPYSGRTRFHDPETGQQLLTGRAESYAEEYRQLFAAHTEMLANICRRRGWSFTAHSTDSSAGATLLHLYNALSAQRAGNGAGLTGAAR